MSECKTYEISNGKLTAKVISLGCTITNLFVPDKNGNPVDVLLGYDTLDGWASGSGSHNAVVGRFANRIAGGKFSLDGKLYKLDVNNGPNCLHGGINRYEKMIWESEPVTHNGKADSLHFHRVSKDMEQGFPGNLTIDVYYTLTENNELVIEYEAVTDAATPINLTNHAYFNLAGTAVKDGKIENVLAHRLQLDCDEVLELNDVMIPTGKILPVAGTCFDFLSEHTVGERIDAFKDNAAVGYGYDHNFITHADESAVCRFGKITCDTTGISMEIFTNQRGIQIYTGNYLDGAHGKNGVVHNKYDGICFEAQRYPDCMNHSEFPSCILHPGEKYWQKTIYKFSD